MEKEPATVNSIYESVSRWSGDTVAVALFGLMVSVPFLVPFHNLPIPSFQSEWLAIFLGMLGLIPTFFRKSSTPFFIPVITAAPAALALVVALQLVLGMFAYTATAITIALYLIWCTLLAVAGRTLATRIGEKRLASFLATFLLAGGLANAIFGLLQYAQLSHLLGGLISEPMSVSLYGIYGNLAQQNHFATHLGLAIVSAAYLCFSKRLSVRWFWVLTGPLLIGLALSGSRSGFLFLGWIIFLSMRVSAFKFEQRMTRRIFWSLAAVLVVAVVTLVVVSHFWPMSPQLQRLTTLSGAIGPRLYLWKHALIMFAAHPILGVGFDSFAYQLIGQLQQSADSKIWGIDQYAHNLVLQILAVSGLCGFVALAAPGIFFLRRQLALPFTLERMWCWGVLGLLTIHSMLEQPLFYAYFLGIAALVSGMLDHSAWRVQLRLPLATVAAVIFAPGLGMLMKTANDYDNIEGYFYSKRYVSSDDERSMNLRKKVVQNLNTYSIFSPLSELIAPGEFVPGTASASAKLELNNRVRKFAPVAETEFRQAALLAEDGRLPEAKLQFKRAALAYPDETKEYLARFNLLAAKDFETYGPLAIYANSIVK